MLVWAHQGVIMRLLWLLGLMLGGVAQAGAAQVYQCKTAGKVFYADQPCGDNATTLTVDVPAVTDSPNPYAKAIEAYQAERVEKAQAKKQAELSKASTEPDEQPVGLSLRDFGLIQPGMSEAQIRMMFGPPDQESVDSVNTELGITRKSYYYVKPGFNANISRIIFTNGSVTDKLRDLVKSQQRY